MKHLNNLQLRRGSVGLLIPVLLASCSEDMRDFRPADGSDGLKLELRAAIVQDNSTRADESGFTDGDRIGVFVVNYSDNKSGKLALSGNQANNVAIAYNADNNSWQAATDIYWLDDVTPADVYGYYPYYSGLGDVDAYRFEVSADQSIAGSDGDMGTYEASDLLWAKSAAATPGKRVDLKFKHVMAGVKVILQKGTGFAGDAWEKLPKIVTVDNTLRTAEVDLSTGVVTPSGNIDRNITMNPEVGDIWRAVVVPQSVESGKSTIGITIDGITYNFNRDGGMAYASGKLHTFTISIDCKEGSGDYTLTLLKEDILPWEADNSSHNFEANSYLTVHVAKAGTLKASLETLHADAATVRNLKITGELTDEDFRFMREEMPELTAVNLKDTKMVNIKDNVYEGNDSWSETIVDDMLPSNAFLQSNSLRRIILPESITRIGSYSLAYTTLSSTIVIPESVTVIEGGAFVETNGAFTIVLPNKLEKIEDSAFAWTSANIDLKLPNTLKYIGYRAFAYSSGIYGTLSLPSELEYLGEEAFAWCGKDLDGEIVIPHKITSISKWAFRGMGIKKAIDLTFHDGVTQIGEYAFSDLKFSSPISFPKNLTSIGNSAFSGCQFAGELRLPDGLSYIGGEVFAWSNLQGSLALPESLEILGGGNDGRTLSGPFSGTGIEELIVGDAVEVIGEQANINCESLRKLRLGKNLTFINKEAFMGCRSLECVVCIAKEPPALDVSAFRDVDLSHCVLEVPENSVEAYRRAPGWSMFRSITAHHELNLSVSEISCLNKGIRRDIILRAENAWEIVEIPSWVHVSPEQADYKEEITVAVDELTLGSGDREGKVVFRLKGSDYNTYLTVRQYDYEVEEDKEIVLQRASGKGTAIPIFIVGEGYGAESIVSGEYLNRVNETIEYLFSIEPYKTYKDMFSVSAAVAVSPDNGAPDVLSVKESKFGFTFPNIDCPIVSDLTERLKGYVKSVCSFIDDSNIDKATIVLISNYDAFAGSAYICSDNCTVVCLGNSNNDYPYDNRGLAQYWIGGAAFALLAPEQVNHYDFIKGCSCPACSSLNDYYSNKQKGYYDNVSLSGKIDEAPWKEFMFHPKYSGIVDMYEGGLNHQRGVWRSEAESVMSTYIPYYNTISRYAIYKQIIRRAGLKSSLEEFIDNDVIEIPQ